MDAEQLMETARCLYRHCESLEELAKYQKQDYDATYGKRKRSSNFYVEEFEKLRKSTKECLDSTVRRQQIRLNGE